jgi:hypothetical protein
METLHFDYTTKLVKKHTASRTHLPYVKKHTQLMHLLADLRSFWSFSVDVKLINFFSMLVDSFAKRLSNLRSWYPRPAQSSTAGGGGGGNQTAADSTMQLSSNCLKKCENRFHFRVYWTCHICISATGRRRIVSRMISSFPRMASWRWWFFTERLQSRIRSNGGLVFLSICVVFQVCELLSSLARLECKNTVAELWSVSRLRTKLCGFGVCVKMNKRAAGELEEYGSSRGDNCYYDFAFR